MKHQLALESKQNELQRAQLRQKRDWKLEIVCHRDPGSLTAYQQDWLTRVEAQLGTLSEVKVEQQLVWWLELQSLVWLARYYAEKLKLLTYDAKTLGGILEEECQALADLSKSKRLRWELEERDGWADVWYESFNRLTFGLWLNGQLGWIEAGIGALWRSEEANWGALLAQHLGLQLVVEYEEAGVVVKTVELSGVLQSLLGAERYLEWQVPVRTVWQAVVIRLQQLQHQAEQRLLAEASQKQLTYGAPTLQRKR